MIRFEMRGEDGQWHEVPGIASATFDEETRPVPPDARADEETWRRYDALDSLHYMLTARPGPRVIDQDGNPVQPHPDRPAWQSPYGPARRSNRP